MQMVIRRGPPDVGAADLSRDASLVVADKGYLGMQKGWIRYVADHIDCPLIQVEANVVVPVGDASPKEEYMAATLRPKITKKLHRYLVAPAQSRLKKNSLRLDFDSLDIEDGENALSALHINRDVKRVHSFHGGTSEAKKLLAKFLAEKLPRYAELRNDPTRDCLSHLSPYLHFGQISPLYIALRVLESRASAAAKEAYLEELIVRRELSMNFTYYNDHYDSLAGLPLWARNTLTVHGKDRREHLYTLKELEQAQTHDPYWNAAQKEMTTQGKMHSYMRMCWGKRIIEWTETPEKAFKVGLHLNDKYGLDGRGPNGYTGVAWCFGKHDRAWRERPIYGKI